MRLSLERDFRGGGLFGERCRDRDFFTADDSLCRERDCLVAWCRVWHGDACRLLECDRGVTFKSLAVVSLGSGAAAASFFDRSARAFGDRATFFVSDMVRVCTVSPPDETATFELPADGASGSNVSARVVAKRPFLGLATRLAGGLSSVTAGTSPSRNPCTSSRMSPSSACCFACELSRGLVAVSWVSAVDGPALAAALSSWSARLSTTFGASTASSSTISSFFPSGACALRSKTKPSCGSGTTSKSTTCVLLAGRSLASSSA
mmetsp:Transcript_54648/g.127793  ORF Transcript_54648/g.127793 Transcript_54648/m.127793 type:complete len:263 (+) Transcript_54648:1835-2623(+)